MSIAVIGARKWGQAIKFALSSKNDVVITSRKERKIKDFVSLQTALDKKHLIIVISAQQINEWLEKNFKYKKDQKILVASKGIDT